MFEAVSLIIKNTLSITFFVLIMMLIIEYVNVRTAGAFSKHIKKSGFWQILVSSILGVIPGCLGTYTVVTLYTHKLVSFGALTAAFIATMGDEAFLLFSVAPKQALLVNGILFGLAIITGVIVELISKKRNQNLTQNDAVIHFEVHEYEMPSFSKPFQTIRKNYVQASPHRALLLFGAVGVILYAIFGEIGHSHDFLTTVTHVDVHAETCAGEHEHHFSWISFTFIVISAISFFIFSIVPEHFLEEHLWNHIIKKHFFKVLIWTSIVIAGVYVLNQHLNVQEFASDYMYHILIVAILIGLIPESGPHVIFISLYLSGAIPLSILLANSIVQDGHGGLPLFAENKRAFVKIKLISVVIGFIVGGFGLLVNF